MLDLITRHFIPIFILMFSMIFVWYKLLNKKIDFKNIKFYITLLGCMISSVANYLLTNNFFRMIVIIIFFIIFFRFLFKETVQKCIVTPVYVQVLFVIAELIYAIIITVLRIDINLTITSVLFNSVSNICIALIAIIISNIKIVKKLYTKLLSLTDKINSFQLLIFILIAMFIENIFLMSTYYKLEFLYLLVFNTIFILICFIIIIYSLGTKNRYNKVSDKYNIAINSLNNNKKMKKK